MHRNSNQPDFVRFLSELIIVLTCALPYFAASATSAAEPLESAHAHNDYWHTRPLLDALDRGFANVEADIFLVDGKLLVGHAKSDLKPERTLESLYLQQLAQRVRENNGKVYANGHRFLLFID